MKYLSGIYAMQICSDDNMGVDWHYYALDWKKADIRESEKSIFGDFGLKEIFVNAIGKKIFVANQLRACLDLMECGNLSHLQGSMRKDYIANEKLNNILFSKVLLLKNSKYWKNIDELMSYEYMMHWLYYKNEEKQNIKEKSKDKVIER